MHFFQSWGMLPARLGMGEGYATLLTHQFLHGDLVHLGSNLLFLWIFGNNMEDVWGISGFWGSTCCAAWRRRACNLPQTRLRLFPWWARRARLRVCWAGICCSTRAHGGFVSVPDHYFPRHTGTGMGGVGGLVRVANSGRRFRTGGCGGVAYWAHAGGFMAGVALSYPLWQRLGGRAFWSRCLGQPPHPEARYRFVASNVPKAGKPARFRPNPWRRR